MSADPQNEGGTFFNFQNHPKLLIFDVFSLIPWGHIYTNLAWRRLGATWERKEEEQRAIVDKVASRKRASKRERAGKPWRGLKA